MNSESSGSTTTNIVNVSGAKITNTIISFVSGNTVSTAPLTLLDKDILCPELFQDITDFSNKDKGIIPDIFLTTYFTFGSHFCSNRVMIQVGDRKPISSNQMVTIIANSGKGKGYVFDFFYKPILEIQSRLIKRDNTQTKFVNSCKAYLNKNEKVTEEDKEKHAWGYCNKLNIDYRKFSLDEIIPEIFTVTSFTPESLAENFGQSKNNSILLCFNEFEDLKENISRTGTVENIFSYLI